MLSLSEQSTHNGGYTASFGEDGMGNPTTFSGVELTYSTDNQNVANTYNGDRSPVLYQSVQFSVLGSSLYC
jgi:hypothetical protein